MVERINERKWWSLEQGELDSIGLWKKYNSNLKCWSKVLGESLQRSEGVETKVRQSLSGGVGQGSEEIFTPQVQEHLRPF